ncbi:hypothetical protein I3843_08G020100 [Carya illinoinensis]|nr:hypothetical protein I3843_08G020100 [Carya illinoinensis]
MKVLQLVSVLLTCSSFHESHIFLHDILEKGFTPNYVQYITLINGMCRVGDIQGAFKLKDEMEALGICHAMLLRVLWLDGNSFQLLPLLHL